ncbi:MAG: Kae1-associated serine/threonine protein kinase [Thermoplasmatales archaeon]|nr:MAG: Kae1-associated serine/threonine protein kinase [Thermoplasmatales archaeon]
MDKKIIYKGAEAEIVLSRYLGEKVVQKRRIPKSYRIKEIDSFLISFRTKEEAKLISEARSYGVSVPIIYDVDLEGGVITMQYVAGRRIKDILNDLDEKERKRICIMIGESVAKLHNNDIIHGDITTSNMILLDDRIHFIDFGLGGKNSEIETKGVDLHVLMEAFESTHSQHPKCFDYVLEGYKKEFLGNTDTIVKKINDIVKRGRYR